MTTARNLLVITMGRAGDQPVRSGDLSLALAGAELIDLFTSSAVEFHDDRIVPRIAPGVRPPAADELLETALASLRRAEPYEPIGDWLWRRGEALAGAYVAAFEAEGLLTRRRHHGHPFQAGDLVLEDSAARQRAEDLWSSADPALMTLAEAVGIRSERAHDASEMADDTIALILATVSDAMLELAAERQRRDIEQQAFDNVWRGPGG